MSSFADGFSKLDLGRLFQFMGCLAVLVICFFILAVLFLILWLIK
jgi:hypothetical protein